MAALEEEALRFMTTGHELLGEKAHAHRGWGPRRSTWGRGARRRTDSWPRYVRYGWLLALLSATVMAACGCTDLRLARASAAVALPSLAGCVSEWNDAALGTGRDLVRSIARVEDAALMATSSDGVCVLAFAPAAGHIGKGVYFSLLHGDYDQHTTPVNGSGSPHPPLGGETMMREPAATQTNVEVNPDTGHITETSERPMPIRSYTMLDDGAACRTIGSPTMLNPHLYRLVRSTAGCAWARSLIFAYEAREGALLGRGPSGAPIRDLAGWRCSVTGPYPAGTVAEQLRVRFRCVRRTQIVEARGTHGNVLGRGTSPR